MRLQNGGSKSGGRLSSKLAENRKKQVRKNHFPTAKTVKQQKTVLG